MSIEKIELTCQPKSCWETYKRDGDRAAMDEMARRYVDF